ncbi:hypothetical protein LIER_27087 [Lithospermum erythrorhizon]|uniref:Uncharacterized protein n=1 Tax=Lithospermum erythrorhizon TaxID=34254 RepID=A0AAV3REF7_LITER
MINNHETVECEDQEKSPENWNKSTQNVQEIVTHGNIPEVVYPSAKSKDDVHGGVNEVAHDTNLYVEEQVASNLGEKNLKQNFRGDRRYSDQEESFESWKTENEEIVKKPRRASGGIRINKDRSRFLNKRISKNVPDAAIDGITFHSDTTRARWKSVFQRRIAAEKKLSEKVRKDPVMLEIFAHAGVETFVETTSNYWPILVKEFILNLSKSSEWPKGGLKAASLSRKDVVLRKVAVVNWLPTLHSASLTETMASLLSHIGTKGEFNISRFMFDQVVKHLDSHAVALAIGYPRMICGVLLNQHPKIVKKDNVRGEAPKKLLITVKLLKGTHVSDITYATPMDERSSKFVKKKEKDQVQDKLNQVEVLINAYVREKVKLETEYELARTYMSTKCYSICIFDESKF